MVEGGPIDVLTGDWLAELTMLILARTRGKRPGGGYARTFVAQMEQVMGTCLDRGHQGGGERRRPRSATAAPRPSPRSPEARAGARDRLRRRRRPDAALGELVAAGHALRHFETGEPLRTPTGFLTANAYFGCWGIVDALARGADIVVTGRVTDAALVVRARRPGTTAGSATTGTRWPARSPRAT